MKFLLLVCLALPFALARRNIVARMLDILPSQCARELSKFKKCALYHDAFYDLLDSPGQIYNPTFMRKAINVTKGVSACLGEVTCEDTKFLKYLMDGASYIGERVYGDAFNCLSKIDAQRTIEECEVKKWSKSRGQVLAREKYEETTAGFFQCFREKMIAEPEACNSTRANALFQAGKALEDLYYAIITTDRKEPVIYEFNPKLY